MMTRIYLWLLLAAPLLLIESRVSALPRVERGALILDNIAELSPALTDKLDDYLSARQAIPLGFSPKGQLLIATRFGDVDELHLVERAGGTRRQLTFAREPIALGAFSPDPSRSAYVYLEDGGGRENPQLYYQRLGEPAARLLTDGKSMNGAPIWSNSGREVAFFTTARDGVSIDIDIAEPDSGALPRLAVTGDGAAWYPLDWSPDDRKLLVLKYVSAVESYLYVVELASGQKHEVDPSPGKVRIGKAKFSRDGQGVYFVSDRDGEFAQLRYANLFTSERTAVSAALPWDIEELALSRDGRYLAYVSNEAGVSKLNLRDLRSHQELTPPKLPGSGVIASLGFDSEGKRLAFGFSAANQPGDAYVLEIESNRWEAWTMSESGPVNLSKFVMPRAASFPTFDRPDGRPRQLPMFVYEPASPGPHPVLIIFHGGPSAQFRPAFDAWIEYVVNELGFVVIAPNVRGSSGYGKSYLALDNGTLREDAVKDVGALLVWIGLQSAYDAKHVVVSGTAYGGFLTLAAMTNYNERLRGGVELAGIGDLVGFLSGTPAYLQNQRRAEYGDERDPDTRVFLRRISPLTNADRIGRPLLVIQGRNDPRVPTSEAEQIVNRLRARGAEVGYLQANDEGHGFAKKQNRDAYLRAFAQFLVSAKTSN